MWPSSNQGKWNNAFSVSLCARASQVRVMLDAKQPDPELLSMERRVSGEGDSTLGAAALFGLLLEIRTIRRLELVYVALDQGSRKLMRTLEPACRGECPVLARRGSTS